LALQEFADDCGSVCLSWVGLDRHRASSVPMWLMPSKHWSVRPSGDLCLVQKLVEIAHTDEDGIVHEQTAIAARSMTETFLNRLLFGNR
jgi:hypothetical protein